MNYYNNNQQQINPEQFKQIIPQINRGLLTQLVAQARMQGISEKDIQEGLNTINSFKSSK